MIKVLLAIVGTVMCVAGLAGVTGDFLIDLCLSVVGFGIVLLLSLSNKRVDNKNTGSTIRITKTDYDDWDEE